MRRSALLARVGDRQRELAFRAAAVAFVLFSLLDCVTTAAALARGMKERNPIGAALYQHYGPVSLFVIKALVAVIIVGTLTLLPRRVAIWVITLFAVVVGLDVVANLNAGAPLFS